MNRRSDTVFLAYVGDRSRVGPVIDLSRCGGMGEKHDSALPWLVRRLLETIDRRPLDVREPLRQELETLLLEVETLTPVMAESYARALLLTLQYADDGVLQLHHGDLKKMAVGGAAIGAIMAADPQLTPELAFERYIETGERIDVAEPTPGTTRGPSGRA